MRALEIVQNSNREGEFQTEGYPKYVHYSNRDRKVFIKQRYLKSHIIPIERKNISEEREIRSKKSPLFPWKGKLFRKRVNIITVITPEEKLEKSL